MRTKYFTEWGSDYVSVSADWSEASSLVEGVSGGRQVADFRHSGEAALRAALEECAVTEGMGIEDDATIEMIDHAMEGMRVADEDEEEEDDDDEDEDEEEDEDEDENLLRARH